MQEMPQTWVQFMSGEDSLEKELAIHSSILAWKIPWTEEPDVLQSMGSQELDMIKHACCTPLEILWSCSRQSCHLLLFEMSSLTILQIYLGFEAKKFRLFGVMHSTAVRMWGPLPLPQCFSRCVNSGHLYWLLKDLFIYRLWAWS